MTRLRTGHFIYVDPSEESVCAHLIAHGAWEPWTLAVVLKLVEAGDDVVEVGGHVGFYTLALAQQVGPTGSVTTFEANPRLAALARRSLNFNGYSPWATVHQKAASDTPGLVRFTLSRRFAGGGHLYVGDVSLGDDTEIIEVEAMRLDDLEVSPPKLIRIDAEGSEALILRGGERLLQRPDIVLCIEWDVIQLRSRCDPVEFAGWLASKDFKFWQICTSGVLLEVEVEQLINLPACDLVVAREHPLN